MPLPIRCIDRCIEDLLQVGVQLVRTALRGEEGRKGTSEQPVSLQPTLSRTTVLKIYLLHWRARDPMTQTLHWDRALMSGSCQNIAGGEGEEA